MLKLVVRFVFYLILIAIGLILGLTLATTLPNLWSNLLGWKITTSGTVVLDRIQALSQLTTTRYNFSSIVTTERDMPSILSALYGDRLIMVAVGYVDAGIDLSKVTSDDITRDQNGKLTIKLPPPELQACALDESKSYVVSRDTGIFAKPLPTLDNQTRRYAIERFRDMALGESQDHLNVLDEANQRAVEVVGAFLNNFGEDDLKNPNIVTTPRDANTPLPDTCQS
jgi:hypothetical protein